VLARLSRKGEVAIVEEITRVQSVDLVADPATTQGLFEQAENEKEVERQPVVPRWDALTVETLRLHRPDLLEEIESIEIDRLRSSLEKANAQSETLQRRQRILDLLCEHRLSISFEKKPTSGEVDSTSPTVSPSFFEMLMQVEDEGQVEELIAERAGLIRSTAKWQDRMASSFAPKSRDQMSVLATQTGETTTVQNFAKALKLSRG